jgi:hypothetical protein
MERRRGQGILITYLFGSKEGKGGEERDFIYACFVHKGRTKILLIIYIFILIILQSYNSLMILKLFIITTIHNE